jgi:4-hydroxybenzoate polyprenyltransferase
MTLLGRLNNYAKLVRFSHTIFALPFALASVALASSKHAITSRALLWILVAMIGARTAAMGFNRLADRQFDALNPRTRMWELPRGLVGVWEAAALTVAAALIFVLSAYQLNWTCFLLSPVALAIAFFYSLTKRFTWASHLFLGLALAIAPIGAWLAVAEAPITLEELSVPVYLGLAVVFWLAGFDIIYSLQDHDFDRAHGLHSIPVRFGIAGALRLSSLCHFFTAVFLGAVGVAARMGPIYWIGLVCISTMLLWEHCIVKPGDLSRINKAFFDFNAYISIGYFFATLGDVLFAFPALI